MTHEVRTIGTQQTYVTTVTYAEALDALAERIKAGRNGHRGHCDSLLDHGARFHQHRTPEEALQVMRTGWTWGRDKMVAALAGMPTVSAQQQIIAYDVGGDLPDIPAFCAGDPEYMMTRYESLDAATPLVRLYVNRSAHAGIDAKSLANYGAALIRYAMGLEASGISTELWVFQTVSNGSYRVWNRILVKDATAPWDIDRVAFALTNPDMLRRVIFALEEMHPDLSRDHSGDFYGGYGMPKNLTKDQRAELPAGSIVFTKLDNDLTEAEAIELVDRMVAAQIGEAWKHAGAAQ